MGKHKYIRCNNEKYQDNSLKVARRHENMANRLAMNTRSESVADNSDCDDSTFPYHDNDESEETSDDEQNKSLEVTEVSETNQPSTASSVIINPPIFQELMQIEQDQESNSDDEFNYHIDTQHHDEVNAPTEDDLPFNDRNQNHPPNTESSLDFSINDRAMIDLIKYCNKCGTSIRFLDDFMRILKHHVAIGFDVRKAPKRANFLECLRVKITSPRAVPVQSPSSVLLPKFSMLEQIKDLLSTRYFQDTKLCCVNDHSNNRFHQYIAPPRGRIWGGIGCELVPTNVYGENWRKFNIHRSR